MHGTYISTRLNAEFEEFLRQKAIEAERIQNDIEALPEPILDEDEGSIDRPIVLGEYKRKRKAARGQ